MWKKVTGNKIISAAMYLSRLAINLNYFCVRAGGGGRVSSTSTRAECFCAPVVLSMPADISPLMPHLAPTQVTRNTSWCLSLPPPALPGLEAWLRSCSLPSALQPWSPKWRCLVGPTICKITCAHINIFLNYFWVIPKKAASQIMLKVWNSLAWTF